MSTHADLHTPPADEVATVSALHERQDLVPAAQAPVPAVAAYPRQRRLRWHRVWLLLIAIGALGGAGALYWTHHAQPGLPPGIASGNGRVEADEIDIATKFAGRVAALLVEEGDTVAAGQVVARMDTRDLEASLKKAQAQVRQAGQALDEARANVALQQSQVLLATQELDRTRALMPRGIASKETFDQRKQGLDAATAALNAANFRVSIAEHAQQAATHDVELLSINIAENTLVAPRDGRIQYRVANIGEVLPAGGKVLTMIDVGNVYMDIYLPTAETGKARIGDDARIVLDARPDLAIPAKVTFISAQAQFTPKAVETKSERDKLMFRVRVRIDAEVLKAHRDAVKSGVPGVSYVRLDRSLDWPERLRGPARG